MQYQIDQPTANTLLAALERATEELAYLYNASIKTEAGDYITVDLDTLTTAQNVLALAYSCPPLDPEPPTADALETHLRELSFQDMGGGLNDDEIGIILREAETHPPLALWVIQETDLSRLYLWLEGHAQGQADETVDMIASGYEAICPICETAIHTIEIVETVTCPTCGITHPVDETEHAYP